LAKRKKKKSTALWTTRTKKLEFYWSVLIKAMADFTCELSGVSFWDDPTTILQAHHLAGKKGNALRFSLLNGICILKQHHGYGFHHPNPTIQFEYKQKVTELRGENIWKSLELTMNDTEAVEAVELSEYERILIEDLARYEVSIKKYVSMKNYKTKKIRDQYNKLLEDIKNHNNTRRT